MALHDKFDYWSLAAALTTLTFIMFAGTRPPLPMALSLALGIIVFVAGIPVAVREAIPSYNHLLGACCGVFGLAGFASMGWNLTTVGLVLIGLISVIGLVYERVTGRSANIV